MIDNILAAIHDIQSEKGVPRDIIIEALEAALASGWKKDHGREVNVRFHIHPDSGKITADFLKVAVEEVMDPETEIDLIEGRGIVPEAELGAEIPIPVPVEELKVDFSRIASQSAKQVVMQRIKEAERELIYNKYAGRIGELISGKVRRVEGGHVYVELEGTEGVIPPREQSPKDLYKPKATIRAVIADLRKTTRGPAIILSRAHPDFVRRLFELEVPEVSEAVVEIVSVAREPGNRTKISVYSHSPDVDPVGACVGSKGVRVQAVVNELKENIDIINWVEDPFYYIAHALAPADVYSVEIFEESLSAEVVVPDDQVSLAIGRGGQNVRLAAKLTGWHIDIKKQSDKLAAEALAVNAEAEAALSALLSQEISVLGLRKPAMDALAGAGLATLADVSAQTPEALLALSGFGEGALEELKLYFAKNGLTWGEAPAEEAAEQQLATVDIEDVLKLQVSDLPLSTSGKTALLDSGFTSVSDMVGVPTATLLEISGFSREDLEAFKNHLLSLGILYETGEEAAEEGAEGIGRATTRSVVQAISAIVMTNIIFAFITTHY